MSEPTTDETVTL